MHTTSTTLNTNEFNKLTQKIIDSLYSLNPDVRDLYDIHINYIKDSWDIAFLPLMSDIPVIKVNTYTDYSDNGMEILRITPVNLEDFPKGFKFKDENRSYNLCMNYVSIFEFILSLYDFEYPLS